MAKGPQHLDLTDYGSACQLGLYVRQDDSSPDNKTSQNDPQNHGKVGDLCLFQSIEGMYPYSTYAIQDDDIDKLPDPQNIKSMWATLATLSGGAPRLMNQKLAGADGKQKLSINMCLNTPRIDEFTLPSSRPAAAEAKKYRISILFGFPTRPPPHHPTKQPTNQATAATNYLRSRTNAKSPLGTKPPRATVHE